MKINDGFYIRFFKKNQSGRQLKKINVVRAILTETAGEIISPQIKPEHFKDMECLRIIHAIDSKTRNAIIIQTLKSLEKREY